MTHTITLLDLPDKTGMSVGMGMLNWTSHREILPLFPTGYCTMYTCTPSAVKYGAVSAEAQETGGTRPLMML